MYFCIDSFRHASRRTANQGGTFAFLCATTLEATASVVAIFGPGTSVAKAACQIMEIMLEE